MMDTRKTARLGLLTALAMVLSYLESLLPLPLGIPGVKVGLANMAVLFTLIMLGPGEAFLVSLLRVFLSSLLFGSVLSLSYSLAGALLSLLGMAVVWKLKILGPMGTGVVGGVLHNVGQIAVASVVLESDVLLYYLPLLLVSGTVAGIITGTASGLIALRFSGFGEGGR